MSKIRERLFLSAAALISLGCSGLGVAQDLTAGQRELQKAFVAVSPHPSLSTETVKFNVNGVNFEFPRNYIKSMDNWTGGPQEIVTLSLNTVDLQPRTVANLSCFTSAPADRASDCEPLDILIGSFDATTPQSVMFNRLSKHWRNQGHPLLGPDGFERYQLGPPGMSDEAYARYATDAYEMQKMRVEFYDKEDNGNFLEAECRFYPDAAGLPTGSCQTDGGGIDLHDGTCLFFFFRPALLDHFTDLTNRLRAFMKSHMIT